MSEIHDTEGMNLYRQGVPATIAQYGGCSDRFRQAGLQGIGDAGAAVGMRDCRLSEQRDRYPNDFY
jgi:hypothetical protein